MTAKAEKAALESSRQLLRTGVEYLAAVTRRVHGLRAVDRAVSTPNHGGSALMAGAASALKSSPSSLKPNTSNLSRCSPSVICPVRRARPRQPSRPRKQKRNAPDWPIRSANFCGIGF